MSWSHLDNFTQIPCGKISGFDNLEIGELASVQEMLRNYSTILDIPNNIYCIINISTNGRMLATKC